MVKPVSTARFAASTGRSWDDWVAFLDGAGAENLPHDAIARLVHDTGLATGWWSQSVAVAYEQNIGRRAPGQGADGAFSVSVSKTIAGDLDEALRRWTALMHDTSKIGDVGVSEAPEVSVTEKWRYWRCKLDDGSRVIVTISQKAPNRASLAIQHDRLATADDMARWRTAWRTVLEEL